MQTLATSYSTRQLGSRPPAPPRSSSAGAASGRSSWRRPGRCRTRGGLLEEDRTYPVVAATTRDEAPGAARMRLYERGAMADEKATIIDAQADLEGRLKGKDAVVHGRFKGEVVVSGRLVIAEGSRVEATVVADAVEVAGELKGDVRARSLVLGGEGARAGHGRRPRAGRPRGRLAQRHRERRRAPERSRRLAPPLEVRPAAAPCNPDRRRQAGREAGETPTRQGREASRAGRAARVRAARRR